MFKKLTEKEEIVDGIKTSYLYYGYFFNKYLYSKTVYKNDKIISYNYYETGELQLYYEYTLEWVKHGKHEIHRLRHPLGLKWKDPDYKKNDLVHFRRNLCYYNNGKLHGISKSWSVLGHLIFEGEYVNGVQIGTHRRFCWYCGTLNEERHYDDYGKSIGEHKEYHCHRILEPSFY